ncbi:SCAN domain-containing protein 3 [Takifugu flavidus]|uniref:SCAN domain-containing protein 3 n=1 Tax=Takifugu flavidus TaxID=433684 RepID=A0A5C6PHN2_9TELE|nr:SCAN domain-containing protein 3 [Takifugu flavidus]
MKPCDSVGRRRRRREPLCWLSCQLWKTSCIVPVPRTPHPKELNSYRPVALTSHLMKTLERLILDHLCPLVSSYMDLLQFAYQPSIGVDDAIIYLLHTSLTHLEKAGSTVRIMFFDFSSAFNTIQPRLLGDKLQVAGVDHHLTTWILSEGFERYFPTTKDPRTAKEWIRDPFVTKPGESSVSIHGRNPEIATTALKTLVPLPTWYLWEAGFSAVTAPKTKLRSRLDLSSTLRVSLSPMSPRWDRLRAPTDSVLL